MIYFLVFIINIFTDKVRNAIRNSRLLSLSGHHVSKREWWERFFNYFPATADPAAYKIQLESLGTIFKEPLGEFIYDANYKSAINSRRK